MHCRSCRATEGDELFLRVTAFRGSDQISGELSLVFLIPAKFSLHLHASIPLCLVSQRLVLCSSAETYRDLQAVPYTAVGAERLKVSCLLGEPCMPKGSRSSLGSSHDVGLGRVVSALDESLLIPEDVVHWLPWSLASIGLWMCFWMGLTALLCVAISLWSRGGPQPQQLSFPCQLMSERKSRCW